MTSERATLANRRNAQASTGPRTAAGKASSGQNARKHGLSAVDPNPEAGAEIERLAELIAGEHIRHAGVLEAARAVAESQLQLQRVKAFKIVLLRTVTLFKQTEGELDALPPAEIPSDFLLQLGGLERYERRALSRRKFAARRSASLSDECPKTMSEPVAG